MPNVPVTHENFNSLLSLRPLVLVLKKMIAEGKPGAKRLYQSLLKEIESHAPLLQPMNDTLLLEENAELVETLLSTIFPPSTTSNEGIYAITFPFRPETVYASPSFKQLFLKEGSATIAFSDSATGKEAGRNSLFLAYDLILKKFCEHPINASTVSVHPLKDENGLTKYYEVKFYTQFVDVVAVNKNFTIPTDFMPQPSTDLEELGTAFPLENFRFEGLVVVEVSDVTQDQVMTEIKTALLSLNSFSDVTLYDELQQHVESLIGQKNLQIGITPFFKMNGYLLYTESVYRNSLLFKSEEVVANKDEISELCQQVFRVKPQPILYEILNEASTLQNKLLKYYYELGARSLILCPLISDDGNLIGLLEVLSHKADQLQFQQLARIQHALPLFTLALEKSGETLELQTDKMIKEHFTAIQPAVEWKFTEAAFNYLQHRQVSEIAKMPNITFENVYPLYAAIDIRNSSTERNHSIQLDLLEQLNLAKTLLEKISKVIHFPLLEETRFRLNKYITSVSDTLLSDDEMVIYEFLQNDLDAMLRNLVQLHPELEKTVNTYMSELDPQRKVVYHHRREYEESITRINDVLDRFIDLEQKDAQEVYPHYFERYVTDGIEFNIYVGQSLSPQHAFDEMYVRNLKLWQLTLLAKAARVSHTLEKRLALPMRTTQLILAHSIPLSISFRRKERKFDVDGAYNIRYEIVKKRIDKVHVRDTDERLTQPGKIAIVYSQSRELEEYLEFIEYLQDGKYLGDNVEHLELEDTQGISGLKAIRVDVNLTPEAAIPKVELSSTTSQHLLRK